MATVFASGCLTLGRRNSVGEQMRSAIKSHAHSEAVITPSGHTRYSHFVSHQGKEHTKLTYERDFAPTGY